MSGIYDFETHTDRAQVPFILTSTGQRERFWFWREKEDTGFANVTFNFKRLFATPGHELNLNAQYARLGRRGVLPERGVTGPRRERQHACRRHREHRAGDTRLRASTARRTPRGGHQAPAPMAASDLHRGPRRQERDLRGPWRFFRLGREHLRRIRQPGAGAEPLFARSGDAGRAH